MDDIKFSEFSELMTMKNQLIIADKDWLINTYKNADDEILEMAFEGIINIFMYDEAFFYLDDKYLDKVIGLITEVKDNCDVKHLRSINKIIVFVNIAKNKSIKDKEMVAKEYIYRQEYLRDTRLDKDLLISSFCYDALVLQGIVKVNLNELDEKDFVVASLNYLIAICPDFFRNEDVRDIVYEELINIKNNVRMYSRQLRKYAKDTSNLLKNMNKEG